MPEQLTGCILLFLKPEVPDPSVGDIQSLDPSPPVPFHPDGPEGFEGSLQIIPAEDIDPEIPVPHMVPHEDGVPLHVKGIIGIQFGAVIPPRIAMQQGGIKFGRRKRFKQDGFLVPDRYRHFFRPALAVTETYHDHILNIRHLEGVFSDG